MSITIAYLIWKQICCVYIWFVNIYCIYIEKKTKFHTLFLRDTLDCGGNFLKNRELYENNNCGKYFFVFNILNRRKSNVYHIYERYLGLDLTNFDNSFILLISNHSNDSSFHLFHPSKYAPKFLLHSFVSFALQSSSVELVEFNPAKSWILSVSVVRTSFSSQLDVCRFFVLYIWGHEYIKIYVNSIHCQYQKMWLILMSWI